MEDKLQKILDEHCDCTPKRIEGLKKELLNLFSVSVIEVKLICGHTNGGVDGCSYKHKDVYTCKYLRNCDVCGN